MTLEKRFWYKVSSMGAGYCWLWLGSVGNSGYGKIRRGGRASKDVSAHRFSWELTHGEIPEGMQVLHRCDNRRCVNPVHLFLGTAADNMLDKSRKGRQARLYKYGARLSGERVLEIRASLARGESQQSIADRSGVSQRSISQIKLGRTWKHIPEAA